MALREITPSVGLVLVVGDPTSSNSNRLCEVARKRNIPGYLINSPDDIDPEWLNGVEAIGLTAGASTPESVVQKCIEHLKDLGVTETEEVEYTEENVFFEHPKQVLTRA